jgi:hypothetical protein
MIYAIEAVGSGFIKFGKARSVGRRLKELETACPYDLHIIAVADWPDGAETALHLHLRPVHQRGEWFKDDPLTREVLSWMLNGLAGLERLQAQIPNHRDRRKLYQGATPIDPIETRREERRAWWAARGVQSWQ